jgi:hypothetical protein
MLSGSALRWSLHHISFGSGVALPPSIAEFPVKSMQFFARPASHPCIALTFTSVCAVPPSTEQPLTTAIMIPAIDKIFMRPHAFGHFFLLISFEFTVDHNRYVPTAIKKLHNLLPFSRHLRPS